MKALKNGLGILACGLALTIGVVGCSSPENKASVENETSGISEEGLDLSEEELEEIMELLYEDESVPDYDALLDERDAFIEAQQLPPGSTLKAVTPEQKEFISAQTEYMESQGYEVDDELENLYLVVALEACETSILNNHKVNANVVYQHLITDPTLDAVVESSADSLSPEEKDFLYEQVNSVATYGMTFICPADAAAWQKASQEVFPIFAQ